MALPVSWIKADETANQALVRILMERPFFFLPPPLHRLPFRVGNVVEIVGPSPSAKTLILIQATINCILPKEWGGVQYGGLERPVLFLDLDCRFDVLCLSQALERRIVAIKRIKGHVRNCENEFDRDLFATCMKRFLYTRCYNSFEFLSALKTLPYSLQKEKDKQGSGVYMLMIDSIGAYYWMDRALPCSSIGNNNRKNISFQTVLEAVVQEIQRILLAHPMLVLATKTATFSDKHSTIEFTRYSGKRHDEKALDSRVQLYREYMPSVWQSLVSHRILLRPTDNESRHHHSFSTEWLLPLVEFSDHFTVNDGTIAIQ